MTKIYKWKVRSPCRKYVTTTTDYNTAIILINDKSKDNKYYLGTIT